MPRFVTWEEYEEILCSPEAYRRPEFPNHPMPVKYGLLAPFVHKGDALIINDNPPPGNWKTWAEVDAWFEAVAEAEAAEKGGS